MSCECINDESCTWCDDPSETPTCRIAPTLTWEEYCAEVGVDPHDARRASVPRALCAMIGGKLESPRVPTFSLSDTEPSVRRP